MHDCIDTLACPYCGGRLHESRYFDTHLGWICDNCMGFLDMHGAFHVHTGTPEAPTTSDRHKRELSERMFYNSRLRSRIAIEAAGPCKYCADGKRNEYQHTHSTKLYISKVFSRYILETEVIKRCPPFSICSERKPIRSGFFINFCPECGRDLRQEGKL